MRRMTSGVTSAVCVGFLVAVSACGGGSGGDQGELADKLIDSAKDEEGVELDEDCARDVAAKFSDDDAKALLDNFDDNADLPTLSSEGQNLLVELFSCADISGLDFSTGDLPSSGDLPSIDVGTIDQEAFDAAVDAAIANLPEGVDKECVRDALQGVDPAQLASGQAPEFVSAMTQCMSGG